MVAAASRRSLSRLFAACCRLAMRCAAVGSALALLPTRAGDCGETDGNRRVREDARMPSSSLTHTHTGGAGLPPPQASSRRQVQLEITILFSSGVCGIWTHLARRMLRRRNGRVGVRVLRSGGGGCAPCSKFPPASPPCQLRHKPLLLTPPEQSRRRTTAQRDGTRSTGGLCGWGTAMQKLRMVGISGGESLTGPFRDARRFPSTRWYSVLGAKRTTLGFGIRPSSKDHSLSRRAHP
jgi:hypothetical protein